MYLNNEFGAKVIGDKREIVKPSQIPGEFALPNLGLYIWVYWKEGSLYFSKKARTFINK